MIISTLEELRLFLPSNAIDNIDSLVGFVNSSEHDFLKDKLGSKLYDSLAEYYNSTIRDNFSEYLESMQTGKDVAAYARLLYLAQKAVAYDAASRAISLQAISVNGMGVNMSAAENYKTADSQSINDFKKACVKEAHSAINELLQLLEKWAIEIAASDDPVALTEEAEMTELWKQSRYFYLAASLVIPSATVLQEYYNIYDSREKFIQMLPDLRYIQEDVLAPIFGEEVIDYLSAYPWEKHEDEPDKHVLRILHNVRKIAARHLEIRQLKATDPRSEAARNEALKLTSRIAEYMQAHQEDFGEEFLEAFEYSPLYVDSSVEEAATKSRFENNGSGSAMFVTPGLM